VTAGPGAAGGAPAPADVPPPEPLPAEALDSHCHLEMIERPVAEVMAAARAAGITRAVTIGTDLASSNWAAQCAYGHPDVYAAVAVHPNETVAAASSPAQREEVLAQIAELAMLERVRAIGETGLDYYREYASPVVQQDWFRAHIAIAKQAGKALVIHDRDAHQDVLDILEAEGPPEKVIFHCFSGDAAMAKYCAGAGYVMSFAGNVTFKNAGALREAAAVAPVELLLVETDAPFLTPVPYRGKPNSPALAAHTVRALAGIKQIGVADLCAQLTATGERMFGPW
jgi:TatD DNase family protein